MGYNWTLGGKRLPTARSTIHREILRRKWHSCLLTRFRTPRRTSGGVRIDVSEVEIDASEPGMANLQSAQNRLAWISLILTKLGGNPGIETNSWKIAFFQFWAQKRWFRAVSGLFGSFRGSSGLFWDPLEWWGSRGIGPSRRPPGPSEVEKKLVFWKKVPFFWLIRPKDVPCLSESQSHPFNFSGFLGMGKKRAFFHNSTLAHL